MFAQALLVFACVAAATAGTVPDPFSDMNSRIVGGFTAAPGQIPYQISLRTLSNFHFCGASLVNTRWVISAAHCTDGTAPASIFLVAGAHNRITGGTRYNVVQIENHPNYNGAIINNDISLVKSASPIAFNNFVRPVPIGRVHVGAGVLARGSGWGQTSHPGAAAEFLQFLDVHTLSNPDCRSRHIIINAPRVFDNTICTFIRAGSGMCMGDSGGPLVANGVLIGAVSWGQPCAVGRPDVFARISSHLAFIDSHINQL